MLPVSRVLVVGVALLASPALVPAQTPSPAAYDELDNVEGLVVSTNLPVVTPMCLIGLNLFAINQHGNTVSWFTSAGALKTYDLPWSPSSIASWTDPFGTPILLVVCSGNYCVVAMEAATGEILDIVQMVDPVSLERLAEPRDIVVNQAKNVAYVSCSGSNAVLELDLVGMAPTQAFYLPAVQPVALALDAAGGVLVTPLIAGNASAAEPDGDRADSGEIILDLDPGSPTTHVDTNVVPNGLPDTDLFRIDPMSGTVEALARAVGTVLFDVAINPTNQDVVIVGTDALNKTKACELDMSGEFSENILVRFAQPVAPATPYRPTMTERINLDEAALGGTIDPLTAVGQPGSVDFRANGNILVTGILTDNIMELDAAGNFIREWDLPDGSIPRAVLRVFNVVFVYCWGSNRVLGYVTPGGVPTEVFDFDLGHDPTEDKVKQGREIFYDGSRSLHQNSSCATCHVDGRTDLLIWDLGCENNDKGPLLTQPLTGIEETLPLHWRGERKTLEDFNVAFKDLLGDVELTTTEMDCFKAFIFSIESPANPNQSRDRLINDSYVPRIYPNGINPLQLVPPANTASALEGREFFNNVCVRCHMYPAGSNNDFLRDGNKQAKRRLLEISHFKELERRRQDSDPATREIETEPVFLNPAFNFTPSAKFWSFLGANSTHAGLIEHHGEVVNGFTGSGGDPTDPIPGITRVNTVAYFEQFDQGLSAGVHYVEKLSTATEADILQYLVDPALNPMLTPGNPEDTVPTPQSFLSIGLAVFGRVTIGGVERQLRWSVDPNQPAGQEFVCEDPSVPPTDFSFFVDKTDDDEGCFIFCGLPKGMERRFGIDYDNDDLTNFEEEVTYLTKVFDPDTDNDGLEDGFEVRQMGDPLDPFAPLLVDNTPPTFVGGPTILWTTARVAKLVWETNEKTTADVDVIGNQTHSFSLTTTNRRHQQVIHCLDPGTTYTVDVHARDLANNKTTATLSFTADNFGPARGIRVSRFENAPNSPSSPAANIVRFDLEATVVNRKTLAAEPDLIMLLRVFVNGALHATLDTLGAEQGFLIDGVTYNSINGFSDGPFVISDLTDVNGNVSISFEVIGADLSDIIEIVIHEIPDPEGQVPNPQYDITLPAFFQHILQETPKELRQIILNPPGC